MSTNHNSDYRSSRTYYDLDRIKEIPILDVCRNMLHLDCEQKSGRTWCKTRPEKTASTLLHEDKNTFYDFGTQKHGDVVHLVSYVWNMDTKAAIRALAKAYDIQPQNASAEYDPNELSMWEYEKIGLSGDSATKNFDFNHEHLSIERMYELSRQYDMPMNQLRKKHPKIYEKILRNKALPYICDLRNEYYLSVWTHHQMMKAIGKPDLFYSPDHIALFDTQIKDLQRAERILNRAIHKTEISPLPVRKYDVAEDFSLLSKGEIKPVLGPASYIDMKQAARKEGSTVKYKVFDYDSYVKTMLHYTDGLQYSAFLTAGRVVIGYLEKDEAQFRSFFEKMQSSHPVSKTKSAKPSKHISNRSRHIALER